MLAVIPFSRALAASAALLMLVAGNQRCAAGEVFADRGYYLTFMRMPVMALPEWKEALDCFAEDDANLIILWTAGGFRSKKYPISWRYNEDHENVRHDFVRDLIDYAHGKGIRVLLGFTPFGYDGVNQIPLEHPELKARKPNGEPVDAFGIHAWGWNLCASQPGAQMFMREYAREMFFDFYPNADGLFIESSDYGICHCPNCGPRYYEREFEFVRGISEDVWSVKTNAVIVVYPHYFSGKKVPGLDIKAAQLPFDPRWTLFFTPHSAHFDPDLLARAKRTIFWGDSPVLGTPRGIQVHAQTALKNGMTGFVPSLEAYSYVPYRAEGGESFVVGKRRSPFGLEALSEGKMPYRSLLARLQRFAVREFTTDPEMPFDRFKQRLGVHLFGASHAPETVNDLLELREIWASESDWYWASPLLDPEFFVQRAQRLHWSEPKLAEFKQRLERLRVIASRYRNSPTPAEAEMGRLAQTVVERWRGKTAIFDRSEK